MSKFRVDDYANEDLDSAVDQAINKGALIHECS